MSRFNWRKSPLPGLQTLAFGNYNGTVRRCKVGMKTCFQLRLYYDNTHGRHTLTDQVLFDDHLARKVVEDSIYEHACATQLPLSIPPVEQENAESVRSLSQGCDAQSDLLSAAHESQRLQHTGLANPLE